MTLARVYAFWKHTTTISRRETKKYLEVDHWLSWILFSCPPRCAHVAVCATAYVPQALYICKLRPLIASMPRVEEESPEALDDIPAKQFF